MSEIRSIAYDIQPIDNVSTIWLAQAQGSTSPRFEALAAQGVHMLRAAAREIERAGGMAAARVEIRPLFLSGEHGSRLNPALIEAFGKSPGAIELSRYGLGVLALAQGVGTLSSHTASRRHGSHAQANLVLTEDNFAPVEMMLRRSDGPLLVNQAELEAITVGWTRSVSGEVLPEARVSVRQAIEPHTGYPGALVSVNARVIASERAGILQASVIHVLRDMPREPAPASPEMLFNLGEAAYTAAVLSATAPPVEF